MARSKKNNVYFPLWNPQKSTLRKIEVLNKKEAFIVFRNSCSAFIKKIDVRAYVLDKYLNECVLCNSTKDLQIDHIISVYSHFNNDLFTECNLESNLQVLCRKCNTSKLP